MNGKLEKISIFLTAWIGTPASILVHTLIFVAIFGLRYIGVTLDDILLILTTAVSLEAIYLAIFIQMTVNRHSEHLAEVGEDIEDIQEEVEDLGEDVEEISEDIEKIQEEQTEDETEEAKTKAALATIQNGLEKLLAEVEFLKQRTNAVSPHPPAALPEPTPAAPAETPEPEKQSPNVVRRFLARFTPGHREAEPEASSDT